MAATIAPLAPSAKTRTETTTVHADDVASLTRRGMTAMAAACVVVFGLTFALSMTIAELPMVGRLGMAGFCTFWLGGGFGLIMAGSAIADHLHNTPEH